jgi:hypothetical protein
MLFLVKFNNPNNLKNNLLLLHNNLIQMHNNYNPNNRFNSRVGIF